MAWYMFEISTNFFRGMKLLQQHTVIVNKAKGFYEKTWLSFI